MESPEGMGGEGRGREGRESLIFLHAHDMLINNGKGGGGRDPEKDEGRGWSLLPLIIFFNAWNYNTFPRHPLTLCGIGHCHDYQTKGAESALPVGPSLKNNRSVDSNYSLRLTRWLLS